MTPAEWLAAVLITWLTLSTFWVAIDRPITRTVNPGGQFYNVCAYVIEIVLIALALVVLL